MDCLTKAKDFHLVRNWRSYIPNEISKNDIKKPGSLLRWLFVQTNNEMEQKRLYDKYLSRFKKYYSASLGVADESTSIPLPKLVDAMTEFKTSDKTEINGVTFDENLLDIMKASIQYPHITKENNTNRNMPSGSAFPFCHYNNEDAYNSGK